MTALTATINKKFRQVRLGIQGSPVYYWISLASAVDRAAREEECQTGGIRIARNGRDGWEAEVAWKSSLWKSKKHCYRFEKNCLTHWIELEGHGRISQVTFFSGTVNGAEEACVPGFGSVYTAAPNFLDKPWSHPSEYTANSAGNLTPLWGSALNGGPLMFAVGEQGLSGWIGIGLLARPGQYGFHTMAFNQKRRHALNTPDHIVGTQAITLDYLGSEAVKGRWVSPKLMLFSGRDAADCLRRYCRSVYAGGYASKPVSRRAAWWQRPIFCTWHEQVALAARRRGAAGYFDQLNGRNVRRWLARLDRKGVPIGTVILDALWQKDDGRNEADPFKFPDFRGFVEELHARNYRVLLWIKAWETKGIPAAWCVTRGGKPVMADPTHIEYRGYAEQMVRRLLGHGPGCYHADGLKIDGTNVLPSGKGLKSKGERYGFELLHAYFKLMYDAAKSARSDALVSVFTANPYMADCCDMVRLGDLYTFRGDPIHTMRWRAATYRAALPHALIDTDGALHFSVREDTEQLLAEQAQLGVPSLYQADYLVKSRPFVKPAIRRLTQAEYCLLRRFCGGRMQTARRRPFSASGPDGLLPLPRI
ncbi:MAG: hypothetical protein GXY44_07965, partial [Phycisphaerales bacterium]|nr:hypothetical protein [Phycisphaerales bacterium]